MPQVTTPDGRVIYLPDTLGLGPPPVAPVLAGGPQAAPPPEAQPQALGFLTPETRAAIGLPSMAAPAPEPAQDMSPVQNSPDVAVAPPVQPKTGAALAKSNKQYGARQAQQAAYSASPEGRAARAEQEGLNALGQQQAIAEAAGEVASREAQQNAQTLEQRNLELQGQRMDQEKLERERAKGLADRQAAYDKAVDTEASYKIDEGRKWRNASTGAKVLAGIGVAMTALGDALQYKNGPNLAIQMIQQSIRDDVSAQVREREQLGKVIDRRRNSLDQYRQMTGDLREAANLKIAEEYKRAADQMEMTAAKFADPKAKLQAAQNAAVLRGDAAKLSATSAESAFNREQARQQLAISKSNSALGWANYKQGAKEFNARMSLENRKLMLEAAQLDAAGNAAQAKALREEASKNNELGMVAPATPKTDEKGQPILNPDGTPVVVKDAMLRNQDGSIWRAPKDTVRNELAKKMTAAQEITSIIDEVLAIREKVGGESSWGNSAEFQRLKVLQNQLQLLAKSGTQGMSSDQDMEALRNALGAGDITSFRDRAAGLEEGRRRTVDALNSAFKYEGNYSGERLDFPRTVGRDPILDDKDAAFKEAIKGTTTEDIAKVQQRYKAEMTYPDIAEAVYGTKAPRTDEERAAREQQYYADLDRVGINPSARQILATQAATLASPTADPKAKSAARDMLRNLSEKAASQATRDAAAGALLLDTQRAIGAPSPIQLPYSEFYTPKAK